MKERKKMYFDMKVIIGLVVVIAGLILLLENLELGIDIHIWDYWPVLVILIGIGKILQPKGSRQLFWGGLLMGIGMLFQLNNLGIIDFWFDDLWPIIIILIGLAILRGSRFRSVICYISDNDSKIAKRNFWYQCFSSKKKSVSDDYVDITTILGGGDYNISSKQFKGGQVTVIMGGCDLDFRKAVITESEEKIFLDNTVVMGGIDLRVPSEWQVVVQGSPILGAVEDKTTPPKEPCKKVIIRGSVIMGAIEIKN